MARCFSKGSLDGFDGEALTIGELATTQMACEPLGEAVQREYVAALARVAGWRLSGDELVLLDAAGAEQLRFSEPSPVGDREATAFLQVAAVASPIVGTEITASFGEDGTLAGSAGCNPYNTIFMSERGAIEIAAPGPAARPAPSRPGSWSKSRRTCPRCRWPRSIASKAKCSRC